MTWDTTLVAAGHALCAAAFVALFLLVAIGRRSSPNRTLVLLASGGTALWAAGSVAATFAAERPIMVALLEWPRIAGWLVLILALLAAAAPARKSAYRLAGLIGIGLPLVLMGVLTIYGSLFADTAGSATAAWTGQVVALLAMIVFGLTLLETLSRWMSSRGRLAASYFFLGVGALLAVDLFLDAIILMFGRVDLALYGARGFISALVAPLIAVGLVRQRDWLIDLHVSRQVIVNVTTLLGAGLYLLAMALAGYVVREANVAWGPTLHLTFLAGAAILLFAIVARQGFRQRLNAVISRHFYSAKYDYRSEWMRFSEALSTNAASMRIEERLLDALLESVACRRGALWLRLDDDRGFMIAAARPLELLTREERSEATTTLFAASKGPMALTADGETRAAFDELARWSELQRPWAGIPLWHRGHLTGFVVLADSLSSREPDAEDREFLQVLSMQAAAHLAEERSAVTAERSRKFEASARHMTYVGHDLKNIVSQLSMVLQNWTRHRTNAAFLAELPDVLRGAVDRMKTLLEGFKPSGTIVASEQLDVRQCLMGLAPIWRARHPRLVLNIDAADMRMHGKRDELQSIFDHLVGNAIEASDEAGEVVITSHFDRDAVVVTIEDGGNGISAEAVARSRFRSTESGKPGGFGVGLFQVRDYIHRLGGHLAFSERAGGGTVATVRLPATLSAPPENESLPANVTRMAASQ